MPNLFISKIRYFCFARLKREICPGRAVAFQISRNDKPHCEWKNILKATSLFLTCTTYIHISSGELSQKIQKFRNTELFDSETVRIGLETVTILSDRVLLYFVIGVCVGYYINQCGVTFLWAQLIFEKKIELSLKQC